MSNGLMPWAGLSPPSLLGIPGTRMVFNQQTAPIGWTIDATVTDHTIQLIAGGGANVTTSGNAYSGMFLNAWTSGGHALTVGELAVHTHTDTGHTHTDSGHVHQQNSLTYYQQAGQVFEIGSAFAITTGTLNTNTGFASLNNASANIQNTGSGTAHSHTTTFNVNYCQCLIGVKA